MSPINQGPRKVCGKGRTRCRTAPAIATDAEFVFVFDKAVDQDDLVRAVTIELESCPDKPNPPAHAVPVQGAWTVPGNPKVATIRHATEAFTPGCTYTLSLASDKAVTDFAQCLDKSSAFSFRVRDRYEPTPLKKDAVSVRYRPQTFDVAAFKLPDTMQLATTTIVQRYAEDLGIRPYIDSFALDSTAPERGLYQTYPQSYLGVPVPGYGFVLETNADGNVLSGVGHVARGISLDTHPLVSDGTAVIIAINTVLTTQQFQFPPLLIATDKELVIISTTSPPTAPRFRLAWSIRLKDTVSKAEFVIIIDAKDATVLREPVSSILRQCANTDTAFLPVVTPDVQGQVSVDPQATVYGDPTDFVMSQFSNAMTSVYALQIDGFSPLNVPISAQCANPFDLVSDTTFATVPGTVSDSTWPEEAKSTAASYMAVQRSVEYWAAHPLRGLDPANQAGWFGFDGMGQKPIKIRVGQTGGNEYDPPSNTLRYVVGTTQQKGTGAALDETGHEFAHGVFNTMFSDYSALEFLAITEGFADTAGATVEQYVRGDGIWNWCEGGDITANAPDPTDPSSVQYCVRDMAKPDRSYQDLEPMRTIPPPKEPDKVLTQVHSPDAYTGPNYEFSGDPGYVRHKNATVLDHWYYLLVAGSTGVNSLSCAYDLPPPALDWDEAFAVLFHAIHLEFLKDQGFTDLANATVSIADRLFQNDPEHDAKVARVVDTWAAVGVWESFWEGQNDTIVPARAAVDVSPWQPIKWRVDSGLNSQSSMWEVEVSTDSTFSTASYLPATTVTTTESGSDGHKYAVLNVSVSEKSHTSTTRSAMQESSALSSIAYEFLVKDHGGQSDASRSNSRLIPETDERSRRSLPESSSNRQFDILASRVRSAFASPAASILWMAHVRQVGHQSRKRIGRASWSTTSG